MVLLLQKGFLFEQFELSLMRSKPSRFSWIHQFLEKSEFVNGVDDVKMQMIDWVEGRHVVAKGKFLPSQFFDSQISRQKLSGNISPTSKPTKVDRAQLIDCWNAVTGD